MDNLSEGCRQELLARARREEVEKGGTLWTQGERSHGIAVVLSGLVMSQYESRSGRSGTIGFWCAGDLVGLGELGQRAKRQHTVRCLQASSFLMLSFADTDDLVLQYPDFAVALVRALSLRLSWVTKLALGLETGSAPERICTVLLALSDRFGREGEGGIQIDMQLTNEQLAAIAGVTRQFANATLQQLRDRGVIGPGRHLVVTNLEELRHLALS